ncbi:MAG: protein kinase [Planctomycetota bacterium]
MDRSKPPGTDPAVSGDGPSSGSLADPIRAFVGQSLGGYRIRRIIGHGSMGVVFEAEQQSLKRRVALKVLPPSLTLTDKVIQRFLREAESVARISHENIVAIYEIGQDQGVYYYAMQYIEGEALDRFIARQRLSVKEGARLIAQAARAIHVAHQQGIIHRDVKPSNILVEKGGRIVITDFGLARQERSATITESGALVGTPIYMSPEQVRASRDEIDRRTDIYSLGATLYEILCGQPAFAGNTTQEILQRILDREPKSPSKVRPGIAWEIEVVTLKAMEKDVNRRYQTALAMAEDIERFLNGEPILARPSGIFYRSWKRIRKHKEITWLATAVVVLTLIGLALGVSSARRRNEQFRIAVAAGWVSLARRDLPHAVQSFEDARRIRKNDLEVDEGLAIAQYRMAQEKQNINSPEVSQLFNQALDRLEAVVGRGSIRGEVHLAIANLLIGKAERISDSLKHVEKALQLSPESEEVRLGAARYYKQFAVDFKPPIEQKIQLLERASEHVNRALAINKSADGLLLRAEIYIERHDPGADASEEPSQYYDLARQDVEMALRLDPNNRYADKLLEQLKKITPSSLPSETSKTRTTIESDWRVKLAELGLPIISSLHAASGRTPAQSARRHQTRCPPSSARRPRSSGPSASRRPSALPIAPASCAGGQSHRGVQGLHRRLQAEPADGRLRVARGAARARLERPRARQRADRQGAAGGTWERAVREHRARDRQGARR